MNDWRISDSMIQWVCDNFVPGTQILELGSGEGSHLLSVSGYKVRSVEHDKDYMNKFYGVEYVYAPLKNHKPVRGFDHNIWYDKEVIAKIPHDYDLIIVDGPPGDQGRSGFLKYLNLFDTSVPILFDDLNRQIDMKLAIKVSARLKLPLTLENTWEGKIWGKI